MGWSFDLSVWTSGVQMSQLAMITGHWLSLSAWSMLRVSELTWAAAYQPVTLVLVS